jgi:hypothetical protein
MVYLLWVPALTAGASCLWGIGLTISKSLAARRPFAPVALAPCIGYPALLPRGRV